MSRLQTAYVAPPTTGPGTPSPTYSPTYERQEQGEDTGSRQDGAQALRNLLLYARRHLRQRHAAEVYEVGAYGRSQERQDYGDQQVQQSHQ